MEFIDPLDLSPSIPSFDVINGDWTIAVPFQIESTVDWSSPLSIDWLMAATTTDFIVITA